MATLRSVELIGLVWEIAEKDAYGNARDLRRVRACSIVKVEIEGGITGVGEAWGSPRAAAAYLDLVRAAIVGRSIFDRDLIVQRLWDVNYHLGRQNALSALLSGLNAALLDALGKLQGVPVCRLIGGRREGRIPVYASTGYFTVKPMPGLKAFLKEAVRESHRAVKIKIGRSPEEDEVRVRTAREMLGPDVALMVDANANYTVAQAQASMARIATYGIHFYEEPLPPGDWDGYAALRTRAPMTVATGEALYGAAEFQRLIALGGADILQPDLAMCGGLEEGRLIARLGLLANLTVTPHVWGGAVGLAAALHFMASLPNSPQVDQPAAPNYLEYDRAPNPLRDDLLRTPLAAERGLMALPDGPGLGIEIDWKAVEKYRVRL